MGRRAILAEEGWYSLKSSISYWKKLLATLDQGKKYPAVGLCHSYLLLSQVIRQVGNHDLGLGGNTISRGATLTASTLVCGLVLQRLVLVSDGLVGNVGQRLSLSGSRSSSSWCLSSGRRLALLLLVVLNQRISVSARIS